jgi:hypothetical protein
VSHRRLGAIMVAVAATLVSLPALSTGAVGQDAGYVLDLELNEPVSSTVAVDSSGLGHDGEIGSHLTMNGGFADWDRHLPGAGVYYGADHLIMVPDAADGSLDPQAGNFSVEFAFRTKEKWGNVIQKGQAATRGGQVKFQIPGGKLSCMFRTPTGIATTSSGTAKLLNDNVWHTVRCDRTPTSVTMYVDGIRTGRVNHNTGVLDNDIPWTLGGKLNCDTLGGDTADSCDYFPGDIDYLRLIGPQATSGGTDSTAPLVMSVSPTVKATAVPVASNVAATFTEAVNGVSGTSMTLRDAFGTPVPATVSYSATKHTATLDPAVSLLPNTRYTATLDTSITDLAGNPLPPVSWTFTTSS